MQVSAAGATVPSAQACQFLLSAMYAVAGAVRAALPWAISLRIQPSPLVSR